MAAAEVFFRDDEGEWAHEFVDRDGALNMPEIGVAIPHSACYEEIDLAAAHQP